MSVGANRNACDRSDHSIATDVDVVYRIILEWGYPDTNILEVSAITSRLKDPRVSCLFERTMRPCAYTIANGVEADINITTRTIERDRKIREFSYHVQWFV